MQFVKFHEHIVRVPTRVGDVEIKRSDLWEGLGHFVLHPGEYVEVIEKASCEGCLESGSLTRVVDFGKFSVEDRVTLVPEREIVFDVRGDDAVPPSRFTIRLEEPEEGSLFVRFIYEEPELKGDAAHPMYVRLRKNAYEQKDRETIEKIIERRQLAASAS